MESSTLPGGLSGLSSSEARKLLTRYGFNELPSQKRRNVFGLLVEVIKEPMLLMLVAVGIIYVFLGELSDSLMLSVAVLVVIGITFYQEQKTERALAALKDLSSPRALVIRDGQEQRIPGREVTVGDILILREGDRIPADGVVLSVSNLLVDESLLTGESLAVRKTQWNEKTQLTQPGGDNSPFVFSGTLVTQGRAVARVTQVALATQMGQIGKALETIQEEDTLLRRETEKIVRNFALAGIVLCLLVLAIYGLARHDWLAGLLSGLTLSMSLLPEEFSVVLVVFLTLGAWRMSKHKVLTRKTASIETLGAATTLCVDKTGTLTENRMNLVNLNTHGSDFLVSDSLSFRSHPAGRELLEFAYLASQKDPFDPLEKEIHRVAKVHLPDLQSRFGKWELVKEYPLTDQLTALSHVWRSPGSPAVVAAKGSPEAIADLCHLSATQRSALLQDVSRLADSGMRLIGVASASGSMDKLPDSQHDFSFRFLGLLGFNDPVRPSVSAALKECYHAGLRVIMITGDYPGTAKFVAKSIGLKNSDLVLTGEELSSLSASELAEKIRNVNIFARVVPQQKLALVNALKANGEIVAMTGDGVNDAPALKASHIGIAMGQRGTDVARESADLVLLDDDFSSIVRAVRMGRRIFDNLKKAMNYIFAVHIPIAGVSLLPVIFNLPIVLMPAHIAFLELIIDPSCSIVFESEREEANIMDRPPRDLHEPLFNRKRIISSLIQGASILFMVLFVYFYTLNRGASAEVIRTVTFSTLVFLNLLLIITNLSWSRHLLSVFRSHNRSLYLVILVASGLLLLLLYVPSLRHLFHFAEITVPELILGIGVSFFSVLWFEFLKIIRIQSAD
jgi:Ca2+-transporting ATPase